MTEYSFTFRDEAGDTMLAEGLTKAEFAQEVKRVRSEGWSITEAWMHDSTTGEFIGRPSMPRPAKAKGWRLEYL